MKKVLLDFGANKGQGLSKMIGMYNINSDWIIESYEPNPNLFEYLQDNFNRHNLNLKFVKAAVWDKSEDIIFSIMDENDEGSSVECLMTEDRAKDPNDSCYRKHNNIIKVKGINIIDILNQYTIDDYIIIKMDIEGSEFKVLRKLLESKENCKKIKKIYIEWHTSYVKFENENTQNIIINELEKFGISTMNYW